MRPFALPVLALALVACGPSTRPPPFVIDLDPPYLRSVQPDGVGVSTDATFVLRFSEPMKRASIFYVEDEVEQVDGVVIGLSENQDYLVSAVTSPPLSATQRAKTIAVLAELSEDGTELSLTPVEPLDGLKDYVIVISEKVADEQNNKLVVDPRTGEKGTQVREFSTGAGADRSRPRATLSSPPAGAVGVATGLEEVKVEFTEAIDSLTLRADRIGLQERGSNGETSPVYATSVRLEGNVATFVLPTSSAEGCRHLCLGASYVLFVSEEVTDLAGNRMDTTTLATQTFTAATCLDSAAPKIAAASVAVQIADTSATVAWKTDERSTSVVEYVLGSTSTLTTACDVHSAACRLAEGPDSACDVSVCALPTDPASFACAHTVRLPDLLPSTAYAYRIISEDAEGQVTRGEAKSFVTVANLPKIVLNEVLVSPNTPISTSKGEFIELYNAGSVAQDLAGWKVARCPQNDCSQSVDTSSNWTLKAAAGSATLLQPGAFALVTGKSFDATALPIPEGVIHLNGRTDTLASGGLPDTTIDGYALLDGTGLVISTYGAHLGKGGDSANKGKSFERLVATEPDVASNWARCTAATPGAAGNFATPGVMNSVSP